MLQPEAPVKPQVVLLEDGDLIFHIGDIDQPYLGLDADELQQERYTSFVQSELDDICENPGIRVFTDSENQSYVATNVHEYLAQYFNNRSDHHLKEFLGQLQRVLPYHLADGADHVFTLDMLTSHGSSGLLFPHMQRWLQAGGLTEEVGLEAARAMALPFDKQVQRKVGYEVTYQNMSYGQGIDAYCMNIVARDSTFSVVRELDAVGEQDEPARGSRQFGEVTWRNLSMATLGSCACWGVDGMDLSVPPLLEYDFLYEMKPHNVDFARQAVSHILGIAVLARHAAVYEGREDVYANAAWSAKYV